MSNENTETALAVQQEQKLTVTFKGKLVGDLEETIITPELIEEKSKPLLALKINGIFDTENAEKVKEAILKAVKMRTLVEKQADPIIKNINAQAKKDVQAVKDIAQPIYDACMKTQNTLQATYDAWQTEVAKAKQAEEEKLRAKTEGREAKMYELGMAWNGRSFIGYGKVIDKDFLFGLTDEAYGQLVVELSGLQMQTGMTGETFKETPEGVTVNPDSHFNQRPSSQPFKPFDNTIYERHIPEHGVHLFITNGEVAEHPAACVQNDQILESNYFVQVITR